MLLSLEVMLTPSEASDLATPMAKMAKFIGYDCPIVGGCEEGTSRSFQGQNGRHMDVEIKVCSAFQFLALPFSR